MVALQLMVPFACAAQLQSRDADPPLNFSHVDELGLPATQSAELKGALQAHNYVAAEKLLLTALQPDSRSKHAASLLAYAGGVYFLNHDYLNAAIAWKKSDAIVSLPPRLNFALSMTYIHLGHPDWARAVLQSLATANPKDALYPYWLGRLDYDAHLYDSAITYFNQATKLDPGMARAFDNLGLCYFYQNKNETAVANYRKAIELGSHSAAPSPWPYLNLGIALEFMNHPADARAQLSKAIQLDPSIAAAHFHLGNVLESDGQLQGAMSEFREAARLDPNYAEPHFAMARMDRRLGRAADARKEVQLYLRLHNGAAGNPSASTTASR